MAQPSYDARVIVLRKTKLSESDLVLTLMAEDGSQIRAVAKGARKPTNGFSARLELYSVSDVLLARGKNLDVVKEARIVESNEAVRRDMEHAAGAAPMAELLDRVTLDALESPKLFPLTRTALAALGTAEVPQVPGLCAAHLLKTLAFSGFRPSFSACAACGRPLDLSARGNVPFSPREGGALCDGCSPHSECLMLPASTLALSDALLHETFEVISSGPARTRTALDALQLCQQLIREHVGARMKSLDFLFTCGLF